MTTKTDIANMAISHLGIGKTILDLDTDSSAEGKALRTFFEMCARSTMAEMDFNFCKKRKTLGLVEEEPNDEWDYVYTYPSECLQLHRIVNNGRNENELQHYPFKVEDNPSGSGKLIYTDREDAIALITAYVEDCTKWTDAFALAVSFKLAFLISPRIGGPDGVRMGDRAYQLYKKMRDEAGAKSANEEQLDPFPDSGYIASRE